MQKVQIVKPWCFRNLNGELTADCKSYRRPRVAGDHASLEKPKAALTVPDTEWRFSHAQARGHCITGLYAVVEQHCD